MRLINLIFFILCCSICKAQNSPKTTDIRVEKELLGTLFSPNSNTEKLIIIIGDEGPIDRYGNIQTQRNNFYTKLAWALTKNGNAVFSYDKRILRQLMSGRFKEEKVSFSQFIDDATTVAQYFYSKKKYAKIYFLGHGQGSLVAMAAAQKSKIDGVISIAGRAQSIDEAIVSQIAIQMPELKPQAVKALQTLKDKGRVKKYSGALASFLRPKLQPFMANWMQYNPRREIRKIKVPLLIIHGKKDIQVHYNEAQKLHKVKPKSELVLLENANHILVELTGDNTLENVKTYNDINLPISKQAILSISTFLNNN